VIHILKARHNKVSSKVDRTDERTENWTADLRTKVAK